jgi:Cu-Zn family superoxide dismutase
MRRNSAVKLGVGLALAFVSSLVGCGGGSGGGAEQDLAAAADESAPQVKKAIAWINPRSGSEMAGSAIFILEADGRVALQVTLQQTPPGSHALHIHEIGDCSADDGSAAGGPWNPSGESHGKWGAAPHHLGDIGNVEVDEKGGGALSLVTDLWTMGGGAENDILGKSVIVHATLDDFTTQPTGAAGGRIGCGVIQIPQ